MRPLKPCGTRAAYQRHKESGEPVDEACRAANRTYQAKWKRRARTRYPVGTCAACKRERPIEHNGWCESCTSAWRKAGRPAAGPPPLKFRLSATRASGEALQEDFVFLLESGESAETAAGRVSIAVATALRWEREWRKARSRAAA